MVDTDMTNLHGVRDPAKARWCLERGPRLPVRGRARPGPHPGHPAADGGLPASKPGLDAGAHDLEMTIGHAAFGRTIGARSHSQPLVSAMWTASARVVAPV